MPEVQFISGVIVALGLLLALARLTGLPPSAVVFAGGLATALLPVPLPPLRANPEAASAALLGGLVGSPETLRRKLRKFETSNIDQVILLNQAGKNAHEHISEGLELFGKEVMPEFQANEPAHQAWKRQVLNREIELEEIDTEPFRERYGAKSIPVSTITKKAAAG